MNDQDIRTYIPVTFMYLIHPRTFPNTPSMQDRQITPESQLQKLLFNRRRHRLNDPTLLDHNPRHRCLLERTLGRPLGPDRQPQTPLVLCLRLERMRKVRCLEFTRLFLG